jgi:hypothetical protein
VDKEATALTAMAVVQYLAARLITLPIEEAQAFIYHYSAQGWYTNGNPIADWRGKACQWANRYEQHQRDKQNEAARKPARSSSSKQKHDFSNLPDYSFTPEQLAERDKNLNVIDSTAAPTTFFKLCQFGG